MAYDINIGQAQATVRVRRPWAVALLSIVTLSVYSVVWYYKVNREMRDYGSAAGDSELAGSKPGQSVFAVTIGGWVVIPALISYVCMVGRVRRVERIASGESRGGARLIALLFVAFFAEFAGFGGFAGENATVSLALTLFDFAAYFTAIVLIQSRLNAVWQQSGPVANPAAVDALDLAEGLPAG
jgi:Domain of unknown function (DUF4234)